MPRSFLAISVLATAFIALLSPVMARDCLQAPGPCAYQDYGPCAQNGGCYYNSGYGSGYGGPGYGGPYSYYWGQVRFLRAGIPGNPDAGGGPTGASQATNRPRASRELY